MALASRKVDVDEHDLAGVRIDQQIFDGSELAVVDRRDLPTANVGRAVGDGPRTKTGERQQLLALLRVGTDACGVALLTTVAIHSDAPRCRSNRGRALDGHVVVDQSADDDEYQENPKPRQTSASGFDADF